MDVPGVQGVLVEPHTDEALEVERSSDEADANRLVGGGDRFDARRAAQRQHQGRVDLGACRLGVPLIPDPRARSPQRRRPGKLGLQAVLAITAPNRDAT